MHKSCPVSVENSSTWPLYRPPGSDKASFTRRDAPLTTAPVTISELSRIAAMPALGHVPDIVFRSCTAPSRAIGTIASWRGMSTASLFPKSANAASIASMQSGIFKRGSTSSLVRRIIAWVRLKLGPTIVHGWLGGKGRNVTKRSAQQSTIGLLARAIRTADAGSISAAAIEQAKLLLLDTIGCGLAGRQEPAAQAALKALAGSTGPCVVIGHAKPTNVLDAVFLNGVLVRVLDLNDYLIGEAHGEPQTSGHPSDNIPVALAAGSARQSSRRSILTAIVIGYELYARLQQAIDRGGQWDGVTASGLVAPAIAGWLMGLSDDQLAHALALGAARSPTPSIVRTGDISATKSIANALVAQSGTQAALLAQQG